MTTMAEIEKAVDALIQCAKGFPERKSRWVDVQDHSDRLLALVAGLVKERDDWADKWHKVRSELAALKYPGMTLRLDGNSANTTARNTDAAILSARGKDKGEHHE